MQKPLPFAVRPEPIIAQTVQCGIDLGDQIDCVDHFGGGEAALYISWALLIPGATAIPSMVGRPFFGIRDLKRI